MVVLRLLIAALLLPAFQQDPVGELIRKLEDDSADAREGAQKGLSALGESAIPALREVVESPRSSGELKLRAAAAIRSIELAARAAKAYQEPKRLTLKADDTMLREILDEITRQTGVEFDATAVDGSARVTFDAEDLPLFQVLDLLCRDQAERTWEPRDDGTIRLTRDRHPSFPSFYSGPFRTRISAMSAVRNNDFKARSVLLTLSLQADWDRRLKPSKIVELEIAKAVDNLGTVLEVAPFDANMPLRGGPGMQLRLGVGMVVDSPDSSRSFTFRGANPAATTVDLEGVARYAFALDQREVVCDKPANPETKDLGDTTIRLLHNGTPEMWTLSFHRAPSSTSTSWSKTIAQRFDPDSFVVVDQDGVESQGLMRQQNRGRQFQDNAAEFGVWYMAVVQRNTARTIKEVRFRFVDQTLMKPVNFKFSAVPLP